MDATVEIQGSSFNHAHLPDPSNLNSLFDLLALCTLLYTINAFDFRTYELTSNTAAAANDQNSIQFPERIACMYARGKVLELLDWLEKHYDFMNSDTGKPFEFPVAQIFSSHFADLHQTLLSYKANALTTDLNGPEGCTLEHFEYQLTSAIQSVPHVDKAIYRAGKAHLKGCIFDSLGWTTTLLSEVRLKKNPVPFCPRKGMLFCLSYTTI